MPKPILIVEDNPNDLELTLNALGKISLRNQVVVARDGAEAADYLFRRGDFADRLAGNPAVVLLDLKLPKLDGLELLEMVRADEDTKRTPVVLLTSSREERDIRDGYRLGVNAYVVKPVEFREFVQTIRDMGMFWGAINEPPPGTARAASTG